MITVFPIVTKECELNIVNEGRIDSQSNKRKNIVTESNLVLGNYFRSNGADNDEEIEPRSWRRKINLA